MLALARTPHHPTGRATIERALSLHQLVAPDIAPARLVRIAAALGCAHVCLFTEPAAGLAVRAVVESEMAETRAALRDCGITAWGAAAYALRPESGIDAYRASLERAALLGARKAGCRVLDPDEARAADNFARFGALAGEYGIAVGIEFTGWGNRDALPQALRIIRAAGSGGITIDALHLVRTGTPMSEIAALSPALINYVQLCDGPLECAEDQYNHEGGADRLPPGEGDFPLEALLRIVPADQVLSLEVPREPWRAAGMSAEERAGRVVAATRALLGRGGG